MTEDGLCLDSNCDGDSAKGPSRETDCVSAAPVSDQLSTVSGQQSKMTTQGVLLYYKYISLGEDGRVAVKEWYESECSREGLRGRIRVALDGVNCTLGGDLEALRRHVASVQRHGTIQGDDIDFKLSCSRGARNPQAAMESGFTTLSVKAVKEVVSMGKRGEGLSPRNGGKHISPREFHEMLRTEAERCHQKVHSNEQIRARTARARDPAVSELLAEASSVDTISRNGTKNDPRNGREPPGCDSEPSDGYVVEDEYLGTACEKEIASATLGNTSPGGGSLPEKETVLLDVRNVYETSIGHFSVDGVETLDPKTRQFSDLPKWVDDNLHRLRGKRVLMYCTGGVRCEKASALLRERCDSAAPSSSDDTEIMQLSGGIERYLQLYSPPGMQGDSPEGSSSDSSAAQSVDEPASYARQGHVGMGSVARRGSPVVQTRNGDQGFFRGKNFVFDDRVSVPECPAGGLVVGSCICCACPWDDYGSRSRCSRCRMLVLVCDDCVQSRTSGKSGSLLLNIRRDAEIDALSGSDTICEVDPMPVKISFTESRSVTDAEAAEVARMQHVGGRRVSDELVCISCQGRLLA